MTKSEMARKLAQIPANGDRAEENRLYRHHMGRSAKDVRESLSRWQAVERVTPEEIRRHCNVNFIH